MTANRVRAATPREVHAHTLARRINRAASEPLVASLVPSSRALSPAPQLPVQVEQAVASP